MAREGKDNYRLHTNVSSHRNMWTTMRFTHDSHHSNLHTSRNAVEAYYCQRVVENWQFLLRSSIWCPKWLVVQLERQQVTSERKRTKSIQLYVILMQFTSATDGLTAETQHYNTHCTFTILHSNSLQRWLNCTGCTTTSSSNLLSRCM